MGKIEQQLRKIPQKYSERVFAVIAKIVAHDFTSLDRRKLHSNEDIFRVRVGNYRIIYHDDGEIITFIDVVRRNENTYKNF